MAPLYKPPTKVVISDQPYLSLVTQIDPRWANLKYREIEYEFDGRVFRFNPYFSGAYSGLSNTYPVGAAWGQTDPAFVALSSINLGTAVQGNAQSVSLTLPVGVAAGSLIAILIADSSFSGPISGDDVSDNAGNAYETLFSSVVGLNGYPVALVFALTAAALGQGATLTYTSPGTPSGSTSLVMAGVAVVGGIQPTIFDVQVGNGASNGTNAGNGLAPSVTSGSPAQQNELFIGLAAAQLDTSFTADAIHGWNSFQQASSTQITLCTSLQNGGVFDPGSNASVIFAPALAGSAPWTAFVIGVMGNKPMYSGIATGPWA